MDQSVITLVTEQSGNLGPENLQKVLSLLQRMSVETVGEPDWLAPGRAVDIFLNGTQKNLLETVRKQLVDLPATDVFVQTAKGRFKKILVADMDATIIRQETLDELAVHLGIENKIRSITQRAMQGELDFHTALAERVMLLRDLPESALHQTIARLEYAEGARDLVSAMNTAGAKCLLVSGGFDLVTRSVAQSLGFYKDVSNRLEFANGRLTGRVLPPIVDKEAKKAALLASAQEFGISPDQVIAVGDGANDIPMLSEAGTGVGYHAKPAVRAATPYQVRYSNLTALLFLQGYRLGPQGAFLAPDR